MPLDNGMTKEEVKALIVKAKSGDNGKRLHITAGDAVIYNEVLNYDGDQEEYDVIICVPKAVVEKYAFEVKANGEDVKGKKGANRRGCRRLSIR